MSIWLKNEVDKLRERVVALEAQDHGGTNALQDLIAKAATYEALAGELGQQRARIEKLEALSHTHNFGPRKRDNGVTAPEPPVVEAGHGEDTL